MEQKINCGANVQIFNYNGKDISMRSGNGVVYVNLTEIAKAFPEKNLSKIVNSQEISDYIQELNEITNVISADLLIVAKGGNPNEQGTWAHQKVALRVCQKLSTKFAIWIDTKIEELLTKGVATIASDDETILHAINVLQKRVNEGKQRIQILEGENEMQQGKIKVLAPKADYTDQVLQSTTTYTSTQIAKELGISSAKALHKRLHEIKIMFKQSGQWLLYADYCGKDYTENRTYKFTDEKTGQIRTNTETVWTEKGRMFLHDLFNKANFNSWGQILKAI